ncbi:MAG: hypothetical protein Q9191_001529 [Dirinaria sp. TL-2023a]
MPQLETGVPRRHDHRPVNKASLINSSVAQVGQDYDCFYAAVFEREDPRLRYLPFAVQQKQIIVTCNYEARRRGLYKLQLVSEAKKKCPDVIIALGEDLTRFRNASKELYAFLRKYVWSNKVERLGFDEVFLDVTDMVDFNMEILNLNSLSASFFHLDRNDPTAGFPFDGAKPFGHTFPSATKDIVNSYSSSPSRTCGLDDVYQRLVLGSHLAQHIRHQLEEDKGYTSTVGISTNKLLSKLVGNLNKPKGQTTLLPPYSVRPDEVNESRVTTFLDNHDIEKIPGIGFKTAQTIRQYLLQRPAAFDAGLVYGGTKENVSVRNVRLHHGMNAELLDQLLAGPGAPRGFGSKIWGLINGIDDSEVGQAKDVPQQISVEDSYIKLDFIPDVKNELIVLGTSLIKRMRLDLTAESDDGEILVPKHISHDAIDMRRWIAYPRTLRLTTRPRPPKNPDGSRSRTFNRISKSCTMPSFVFSLSATIEALAARLAETLIPLFHQLHPEKSNWDLSLVNLCATNMSLRTTETGAGSGRDIGRMFKRQEEVLKDWKIKDIDVPPEPSLAKIPHDGETTSKRQGQEEDTSHNAGATLRKVDDEWSNEDEFADRGTLCQLCGAVIPSFAEVAHQQFVSSISLRYD